MYGFSGNHTTARYVITDMIYRPGCSPEIVGMHYVRTRKSADKVMVAQIRDMRGMMNGKFRAWRQTDNLTEPFGRTIRATRWEAIYPSGTGTYRFLSLERIGR